MVCGGLINISHRDVLVKRRSAFSDNNSVSPAKKKRRIKLSFPLSHSVHHAAQKEEEREAEVAPWKRISKHHQELGGQARRGSLWLWDKSLSYETLDQAPGGSL
ncbi:hypothetical protein E2C01_007960 [Portunus trituberculatus]|uniref:Uncharacterized protein n=1 Tax=Portunus trituberculatus TaxID=210409 RepID=A0A5B7D3P8_PORTR|nr:hypothetical protein [Portunus trituberculatus]